jgi:hypothetical protein
MRVKHPLHKVLFLDELRKEPQEEVKTGVHEIVCVVQLKYRPDNL